MKTSKIFSLLAVVAAFALTSCVHKGDLHFEKIPDITFSYVWNCPTLELTACNGATDVTWELPDLGITGSGSTFSHTFDKAGSYWVVMKAKYNGEEQVYSGIIALGKTSVVKLDDKSLDDWNEIKTSLYTEGAYQKVKYDFDTDYIYIYFEANATDGFTEPYGYVVQLLMDNDGCSADGSDFKWKYNFEGCPSGDSPSIDIGNTNWESYGDPTLNAGIVPGAYSHSGGIVKCEYGIKRSVFGINKDGFAFRTTIIDPVPWSTKGKSFYDAAKTQNVVPIDLTIF